MKIPLILLSLISATAFAAYNPLSTKLDGNVCVVKNTSDAAVNLKRVLFYYSCEDSILRRAPVRIEESLDAHAERNVFFPGPEGGCMNYFVHSCKAISENQ